jgi:hypothetical protein
LTESIRPELTEMAPLLRRAVALDARALARIRTGPARVSVLVRLPFAVLVARTVAAQNDAQLDRTVAAADLLGWLDGTVSVPPEARDAAWRGATPPTTGWLRVDAVPDDVIRGLVRSGATALQEAASREGVPDAQPRAEVADALLDAVVLTADGGGRHAEVTLRVLSALTRMGFLPRGSSAAIDVAGRWVRVAGEYGSVFAEADSGLLLR